MRAALADGVPVGAAGSRLLRGNTDWQEAFEINAAAFFGAEAEFFVFDGDKVSRIDVYFGPSHQDGELVRQER